MTWTVTQAEHDAFARLSGDTNPLHTDPLAARRLPFGRVAVHGMHLVLRVLEHVDADPVAVRATFRNPVSPGEPLDTHVDGGRIRVTTGARPVLDLTVTGGPSSTGDRALAPLAAPAPAEARDLDEIVPGSSGTIPVGGDPAALEAVFPHLVRRIGARGVAELLAMTRLVGMHVPGLHSMFSTIDLRRGAQPTGGGLAYTVEVVDERFRLVTLGVESATWAGRLQAFVRPAPVDVAADLACVVPGEFAGSRWLVAGGSRGLGRAAVQLLEAGGADVRATYHRGVIAGAWALDAAYPGPGLTAITADGWAPTHLAWFATPPIFSDTSYDEFLAVYVHGFSVAVERLADGLEGVLWPSSEAVESDVPGLADYAAAKRLGEQRCAELAEQFGVEIVAPRWPRLLTDQSTSFVPVEFGDTTGEVLAALRSVP